MENQKALKELSKLIDDNMNDVSSVGEFCYENEECAIGVDASEFTNDMIDELLRACPHIISIDWSGDLMIINCDSEEYAEEIYDLIEEISEGN